MRRKKLRHYYIPVSPKYHTTADNGDWGEIKAHASAMPCWHITLMGVIDIRNTNIL